MAILRFFDNMFEDNFQDIEYDKSKSLTEQIANFSFENSYSDYMVECYDPDTGKTFYTPLDEGNETSILITVNGIKVNENYEPLENDIVNVVYLPLAWDWGKFAATTFGAVAGGGLMFLSGFLTGGLSWGLAIPTILGMVEGGVTGWLINDAVNNKVSTGTYDLGKEGKNLPDVRGSENQEITGNNFPFVLGKHLVTPFILGQPYTEYSGENGKDAYIRESLIVGYSPLCLTEFRLADYLLAYNQDAKVKRNTVLRGKLKGCSESGDDSGDILDIWKNNDIELEIIQQHPDKPIWYGDIYPNKVVDKDVNANSIYVCDKSLEDIINITYKGTSYPNSFKTNTVQFTESCPKKITVTLDFPQGLYSSHTNTTDNSSNTIYEPIPMWFALQWRAFSKNNISSNPNGSDYINDNGSIYSWHGDWKTDEYFKGSYKEYTTSECNRDYKAHKGNDFSLTSRTIISENESPIAPSEYANAIPKLTGFSDTGKIETFENFGTQYRFWGNNGHYRYDLGHKNNIVSIGKIIIDNTEVFFAIKKKGKKNVLILSFDRADFSYVVDKEIYTIEPITGINHWKTTKINSDITFKYKPITNLGDSHPVYSDTIVEETQFVDELHCNFIINKGFATEETVSNDFCGNWVGKKLFNFEGYSGEDGLSEMRVSFTKEFTKEECLQFSNDQDNSITGVEVRLVRVSPNYLNQTSGNSVNSAYQYQDSVVWKSLVTEVYDEDQLIHKDTFTSVPVLSESDMRKVCCISIKAKADSTGMVQQAFKKLNCIAQSFSPIWHKPESDTDNFKWLPEGITKKTVYYGYYKDNKPCNRQSDVEERVVTKSEYETARLAGYNWVECKEGSTYQEIMTREVMNELSSHNDTTAYFLNENGRKYLETNSASGFMLACVGGQNGAVGLGYEDINLLKLADSFELNEDVTDGSTYSVDTVFNDTVYSKGDLAHIKFEANGYIYQGRKFEDLLKSIAITCRSIWTLDEAGHITIVPDKPQQFIQGVINQQDVISGSNTYSYTEQPAGLLFSFADENDGYQSNNLYCWADGYSEENYHGQVENYSFDFVTNPAQVWSLGRYVLACRLLQRESLSRKIGVEGHTYSINDVLLVQSDELLIGEGSGRVKEILKEDGLVYGVITDSPYKIKYSGNPGVSIVQTKYNGASKSLTFALPTSKKTITIHRLLTQPNAPIDWNSNKNHYGYKDITDYVRFSDSYSKAYEPNKYYEFVDYTFKRGVSNIVLFKEPQQLYTGNDTSFSTSIKCDIALDDIILYGEVKAISQKYKIVKIKQDKDGSFTEALLPYFDELYNYGRPLPSFQSTMALPAPNGDTLVISEVQSVKDRVNNDSNIYNFVNQSSALVMAEVDKRYSNHVVTLYRELKDNEAPMSETGITAPLTYSFATNELTWGEGKTNDWQFKCPVNNENPIFITTATAYGKGSEDIILPTEWATPIEMGMNGIDGLSIVTINMYRRSPTIPLRPDVDGTYNFSTGEFKFDRPVEGWKQGAPEWDDEGNPAWETHVTILSKEVTSKSGDLIVTVPSEKWSNVIQFTSNTAVTENQVKEWIKEGIPDASTPYIKAVPDKLGFYTSKSGYCVINQTIETTVHVLQYNEEIKFRWGDLDGVIPDDYTYLVDGNTLYITLLQGKKPNPLTNILLPIVFTQFTSYKEYHVTPPQGETAVTQPAYGEVRYILLTEKPSDWESTYTTYYKSSNGKAVLNSNSNWALSTYYKKVVIASYGQVIQAAEVTEDFCPISLQTVETGAYLKMCKTISEVEDLMKETLRIGDYFSWMGNTTPSEYCVDGNFKKYCTYSYTGGENGKYWQHDEDSSHFAMIMPDVISNASSMLELAENNPDLYDYHRELFANEISAHHLVIDNSAFIKMVSSAQITVSTYTDPKTHKVYNGQIEGFDKNGNLGFGLYVDGSLIANKATIKGNITAESLLIKNGNTYQSAADYIKGQIPENSGISEAYAKQLFGDNIVKQQMIYIKLPVGSDNPSSNTSWVTNRGGDGWSITKLASEKGYIVFSATQYVTYTQNSSWTETSHPCNCTTPMVDGGTIIDTENGYIKNNLLDVNTLLAGYASIKYLESGNAEFNGLLKAKRGFFYSHNCNYDTSTADEVIDTLSDVIGTNSYSSERNYFNCTGYITITLQGHEDEAMININPQILYKTFHSIQGGTVTDIFIEGITTRYLTEGINKNVRDLWLDRVLLNLSKSSDGRYSCSYWIGKNLKEFHYITDVVMTDIIRTTGRILY